MKAAVTATPAHHHCNHCHSGLQPRQGCIPPLVWVLDKPEGRTVLQVTCGAHTPDAHKMHVNPSMHRGTKGKVAGLVFFLGYASCCARGAARAISVPLLGSCCWRRGGVWQALEALGLIMQAGARILSGGEGENQKLKRNFETLIGAKEEDQRLQRHVEAD